MKFNVEVDCTPEEAREFLGLPDLKPIQAAVLAPVQQQMVDAAKALSPEGILKTWLSLVPFGSDQYLKAFNSMMSTATKTNTPTE